MIGQQHHECTRESIRAHHPDAKYGGYLYVIAFDNGTIKVGRSNRPADRLQSHLKDGLAFGASVTNTWVSEVQWNVSAAEASLIRAMSEMTEDRRKSEYFGGVPFSAAVSAAERIPAEPITPETIAAHELALEDRRKENSEFLAQLFPGHLCPDVFDSIKMTFGASLASGEIDFGDVCSEDPVSLEVLMNLAEVRGVPIENILSMTYIDMLKHLLIVSVETAATRLETWAKVESRDDLLLTYAEVVGEHVPKGAGVSTPLDSLKDAFWLVRDHVSYSTDHLSGHELLPDEHHVYDILDSAVLAVTEALGKHISGIEFDTYPRFSDKAWRSARIYDDGTPVIVDVELEHGSHASYRPRLDGDYNAWLERFKPTPHLSIV